MSVLSYVLLGIAAIVLIIVALFYLVKGLMILVGWFMKLVPTLIKATLSWAIIVLSYSIFKSMDKVPNLPTTVYILLYFVILTLVIVRKVVKHGAFFNTSSGSYKSYVLNKKSKVIHERYSDSAESISPHHRKELSDLEARELINNNEKYRFKS